MDVEQLNGGRPGSLQDPGPFDDTIDLRAYLVILRKRLWSILAVFLAVLALVAFWTMRQPRIYTATTSLIIDPVAPKVLQGVDDVVDIGAGNYWAAKEYYETQYRVIQSREVSRRVVDRLGLTEDLDFLGLALIEDPAERAELLERSDPVDQLRSMISVDPVKDSRMVNVSISDTDPERAALLAGAVADAYLELNVEKRTEGTRGIALWLDEQVRELKPRLEASEQALYDFKRENDMLTASLEDRQSIVSQKLLDLTRRLTEIRARRVELEARVKRIRALRRASGPEDARLDALSEVTDNLLIQKLKEDLFKRVQAYAEIEGRYGDQHPKLLAARESLQAARQALDREIGQILRAIENDHVALLEAERATEGLLANAKAEAFEVNKKEIAYSRLAREQEENRRLYDLVLQRLKEAGLAAQQKVNNVRVVDEAVVPERPVKPRVTLNLLLGVVLGLFAGVAIAFIREFLDTSVKTEADIEGELRLPVIGSIPKVANQPSQGAYVLAHPRGSRAEALRSLRTNLVFMGTDEPVRRMVITSANPSEGKTSVASDLAVVLAQSGHRTVVVDTDMRRPRLHQAMAVDSLTGLTNVLMGEATLEEVLRPTEVDGLFVLPCGPLPPNPAEVLHSRRFAEVLEALDGRFDRVVLDSPPVGAVADAKVLGAVSDGVILVARAGKTRKDALSEAHGALRDVRARVLGVVLNFTSTTHDGYGYYDAYDPEAREAA